MMILKNFFIKQKKLLICISTLILFFICLFVFILKKPFLLENDQWFQYNIFYKEWIRLIIEFIKGNGLPMYSWNMYLGTDFYSAMGYYCTGDIFLPLLLIFRNNVELGLVIETILCVYISAILMNIFLEKYHVENENIRIFISLIYVLGGQSFEFLDCYMFFRFYAFLPLLFIGLLNYFDNKKVKTFIIATSILLLQSYYLMFPTLIFLFLFALMFEIKERKEFKAIIKDFFILLGCLIIGFMISAIITLPSMMYLLNNSRVGVNDNSGIFWQRNVFAGIMYSFVSYIPWTLNNIFKTSSSSGHDIYYSLFITIVPLISCLSYVFNKKHKHEAILFVILLLFLFIKPLSSIMHGFSVSSLRWTFLLEFYILTLAAFGLESLTRKKFNIIFIVYIFILVVQYYLLYKNNYVDYWNVLDSLKILFVSMICSVLIFIIFNFRKNIALILCLLELICFRTYDFYIKTRNSFVSIDAIKSEDVEYFNLEEEDITYRYNHSYKNNNPDSILNQNKSLDYNFMSVSTYNSMSDENIEMFNDLANAKEALDWVLYVDDPYVNTMLGVKYYIVYKEDELPEELDFEYAYNLDYLKVYDNLDYKGFGYVASKVKYTKDFDNTKDFYDYILVDDDSIDLDKYQDIDETKLNIIERHNNYLFADISLKEDNILLIPIPNNKGWEIKVNGEVVNTISVNGGFIGIELNKGYNKIEMNFVSCYFKEGAILSLCGIIIFVLITYKDKRRGI